MGEAKLSRERIAAYLNNSKNWYKLAFIYLHQRKILRWRRRLNKRSFSQHLSVMWTTELLIQIQDLCRASIFRWALPTLLLPGLVFKHSNCVSPKINPAGEQIDMHQRGKARSQRQVKSVWSTRETAIAVSKQQPGVLCWYTSVVVNKQLLWVLLVAWLGQKTSRPKTTSG